MLYEREMAYNVLVDMEKPSCGENRKMPIKNGIHIDWKLPGFPESYTHLSIYLMKNVQQ